MTSRFLAFLALATLLAATSCQPAALRAPVSTTPPVSGLVSEAERHVAATVADVANGATVALIDGVSGQTVATTVSNAAGAFNLNFGSSFTPTAGQPYVLEAFKSLPVSGTANRAGAPLARLRTLLFFSGATWTSLTSSTPGGNANLGRATTAVATIASLRSLSSAQQQALVGKVNGTTFDPSGTVIAGAEFTQVYQLVDGALAQDQDPLKVISYDATSLTYGRKPSSLVINDAYSPLKPSPGGIVTFTGRGFPATGTVSIGGLEVATWSVNAARTQLTTTLPTNGFSGLLQITQGGGNWMGPYVTVAGTVGTLAGTGGVAASVDGRGPLAQFNYPHGIGVAPDGTLYVADTHGHRLRKVTANGEVSTFVGDGTGAVLDGTGTGARTNYPQSMTFDGSGNLYVTEGTGNVIRRITPGGLVTTLAGSGTAGWADGTGTNAQFYHPVGIVWDGADALYVCDYFNNRIRKVVISTRAVTTVAGSGAAGFADGTGTAAQFNNPSGLDWLPNGDLVVADYVNHRIRRVTTAGVVTTMAGSGTAGTVNGTGTAAQFNGPYDVAVDPAGNIYVDDYGVNKIRKIAPDLAVTTFSGPEPGYADGAIASAQYRGIHDMVIRNGHLYLLEHDCRVRILTF